MSKKKYNILSCLLCDDIRFELSRKQILIGVYAGSIIPTKLPVTLPLAVRLDLVFEEAGEHELKVMIISPASNDIAGGTIKFNVIRIDESSALSVQLFVQFTEQGKYKVMLSLDGAPPRIARTFVVRLPTEEEQGGPPKTDT